MKMKQFDTLTNGDIVLSATINNGPYELEVLSLGALIHSLKAPDKNGKIGDLVLGYDSAEEYLSNKTYYGMTVGRFANRIQGAKFNLDGKVYELDPNDNEVNCLHSGKTSLCWKNWDMELLELNDNPAVKLSVTSKDGEGGFPGNLEVNVVYELTLNGRVEITYTAISDKRSILNLTNHSYFNLSGNQEKNILENEIKIDSDSYLEIDDKCIPSGKILDVAGTPFDFTEFHKIEERINNTPTGYDHCFCFNNWDGSLKERGELRDPDSGRSMKFYTTMPGVQMYTADFFDEGMLGKNKIPCIKNAGVALETQFYPDSPNHEDFPSCVIEAGKEYQYKTVYEFSVVK